MESSPSIDITEYVQAQEGWEDILGNITHGAVPEASPHPSNKIVYLLRYCEENHGYYLQVLMNGVQQSSSRVMLERGKIGQQIQMTLQQYIHLCGYTGLDFKKAFDAPPANACTLLEQTEEIRTCA